MRSPTANKNTYSGVLDDGTVILVVEKHLLVLTTIAVDRLHGVGTAEHRDGHDDRVDHSGRSDWTEINFRRFWASALLTAPSTTSSTTLWSIPTSK